VTSARAKRRTLALSARELPGRVIETLGEAHFLQHRGAGFARLGGLLCAESRAGIATFSSAVNSISR